MTEFDVVWNGRNDGHDGDLLRRELAIVDKTAGSTVARPAAPFYERVAAALWTPTTGPGLDLATIAARTGLAKDLVNAALYTLRLKGRIVSERVNADDMRKRPPQHYWRRA